MIGAQIPAVDAIVRTVPLSGMRGAIASAMMDSLRSTAQLTLHREYDADALVEWRSALPRDRRPSLNDLVMWATAATLRSHPELNATIDEPAQEVRQWRAVHLGIAVASERGGMFVPVVRDAEQLTLDELTLSTRQFVAAAAAGRLSMSDMSGGTFTVTNLGSFGVDAFTPVINRPQVAILGVGRMRGSRSTLSLTIDHRATDGVPAGRFLGDLAARLENPAALADAVGGWSR
ncbi:2-oxo acid dehydrogenase subunit E2 [Microbacterium sp. A196]|uniref:2-oxo acid dehydrogenase subunit E2 n=1 Tax=Microbacterium sp. A196 TaxID=3457320 RepID=UPI003FD33DF5